MSNGIENLKPCRDTETARARGKLGGIASGEAKRKKKLMSDLYADFLAKEHNIVMRDGTKTKVSGEDMLSAVMSKVLNRGDSSSVSMMREIREATEGQNVKMSGKINIAVIDSDDDRL